MSDDKQQQAAADAAKPDNAPDWQKAMWKNALDLKAWVRRELAHAAAGVSEVERQEKNP
jgi:hypothetical protein